MAGYSDAHLSHSSLSPSSTQQATSPTKKIARSSQAASMESFFSDAERVVNFEMLYLWQKCSLVAKLQTVKAQIQTWIL